MLIWSLAFVDSRRMQRNKLCIFKANVLPNYCHLFFKSSFSILFPFICNGKFKSPHFSPLDGLFFVDSVKAEWEPTTLSFTGKYFFTDKFEHDEVHSYFTNLTPIFVYFTQLSWLIATYFTVTACGEGGCVSWTITTIWIRSVVLQKYVKGFSFFVLWLF